MAAQISPSTIGKTMLVPVTTWIDRGEIGGGTLAKTPHRSNCDMALLLTRLTTVKSQTRSRSNKRLSHFCQEVNGLPQPSPESLPFFVKGLFMSAIAVLNFVSSLLGQRSFN
jgi:hypothetical protein